MQSGDLLLRDYATRIFLKAVGIDINPFKEPEQFKQACHDTNTRFNGGQDLVRYQLASVEDRRDWDEDVVLATMNLAGKLGMRHGESPLTGKFDLIIASGGARLAAMNRACYAVQAILDNRATTSLIVLAGSTRAIRDDERPSLCNFAPDAKTEFDLYVEAEKRISDRHPDIPLLLVRKDNPKAGNDDIIDEVMDAYNKRHPNNRQISVAMVTTRIYTIGLELDMARAAKRHEWRRFLAAGHPSEPIMLFERVISTYFSECLTTLRKAAMAAAEDC